MECTPWVYCFGERISANLWKRQGKGWFVTTIPSQWFKQRGRLLSRITYHCWLVYLNFLSFCVFFLVVVEEEEEDELTSSAAGGVLLDDNWADAMTTFYFDMKYNLHLTSTNFARTRSAVKKMMHKQLLSGLNPLYLQRKSHAPYPPGPTRHPFAGNSCSFLNGMGYPPPTHP